MTFAGLADGRAMWPPRHAGRPGVPGASRVTSAVASDDRLADVLRLTGDWLFETDATLALSFVSDRVGDDLGVSPASLIGRRLTGIGTFDDGPGCLAPDAGGEWRAFTDRMVDVPAVGRVLRLRFSGVPQFDDGVFAGYRGVARDETREQSAREVAARTEARLRVGLTACRDGLAIFDPDGLLAFANPQISADLGRSDALPTGAELAKLLTHALRSGWFVDCDAPSLTAAKARLGDPANGQSMIEISTADGRTVLFCANRSETGDIVLVSTDTTGLGAQARPGAPRLLSSA